MLLIQSLNDILTLYKYKISTYPVGSEYKNLVIMTLYELLKCLEKGSIPYRHFNIRKLKSRWEGFLRIQISKTRDYTKD